jgi:hypothetical protein
MGFAEKVLVLSRRSKNIVAAKTAGSLDREAILRANETRPAALIGPVVTGAVPFHFIRVEREIPQWDS